MDKQTGYYVEIPLAFFGMGFLRAWTETVYSNALVLFPSQDGTGFGLFTYDLIAAFVLFLMAFSAKRLVSLEGKKWPIPLANILMTVSAFLNFLSIYLPQFAFGFGVVAVVCGGAGIAMILLLWSELFSCLPPLKVGLYFAGSTLLGAFTLWFLKGLSVPWLFASACLLPSLSLFCLKRSFFYLGEGERPHPTWGERHFPWKPIAIVILYSFAYGLSENVFDDVLNIHSGFGCVAASLLVYGAIRKHTENFSFSFMYKIACPCMIVSLIPFSLMFPFGGEVSAFFALASYTLILTAIMVIMSNLCYQYGFNAIWLFGIERAIRLLSVEAGNNVQKGLVFSFNNSLEINILIAAVIAILIVVATKVFLSEASLTSDWGATLRHINPDEISPSERARIQEKCHSVGEAFNLTQREEEVLVYLVEGKKAGEIANEMCVAVSTVKTHNKHIYQKLDIHSRKELCALVGVEC